MPLLSDGFLANDICRSVFTLAVDTLHKPKILTMTGESKAWRTSDLGMKVTDHVYINFRPSQYDARLKEVKDRTHDILESIAKNVSLTCVHLKFTPFFKTINIFSNYTVSSVF